MIASFGDCDTERLYHGTGKPPRKWHSDLCKAALRKLDMMAASPRLADLRSPPGNHLEALSGNFLGFYSIRINSQFRIVFRWNEDSANDVQLLDYHT